MDDALWIGGTFVALWLALQFGGLAAFVALGVLGIALFKGLGDRAGRR